MRLVFFFWIVVFFYPQSGVGSIVITDLWEIRRWSNTADYFRMAILFMCYRRV